MKNPKTKDQGERGAQIQGLKWIKIRGKSKETESVKVNWGWNWRYTRPRAILKKKDAGNWGSTLLDPQRKKACASERDPHVPWAFGRFPSFIQNRDLIEINNEKSNQIGQIWYNWRIKDLFVK